VTDQTRKKRSRTLWTDRDIAALVWIADQYAVRLDHLQVLLCQQRGAAISIGTTRNLVARWRDAGWVETLRIRASEPIWIWPTRSVLRQLDLPYRYLDLDQCSLDDLSRIAAMNEVRLQECTDEVVWVSQRELLEEVKHGRILPNLPDAELHRLDGRSIAIKVELSLEELSALTEFLTGLLRGEGEPYDEVWFVAPEASVRRQIRERCTQMAEQGVLMGEEVERIAVKGYQDNEERQEAAEPQVVSARSGRHALEEDAEPAPMSQPVDPVEIEPRRRRRTRAFRRRRGDQWN
jgi:hypothetical protein